MITPFHQKALRSIRRYFIRLYFLVPFCFLKTLIIIATNLICYNRIDLLKKIIYIIPTRINTQQISNKFLKIQRLIFNKKIFS